MCSLFFFVMAGVLVFNAIRGVDMDSLYFVTLALFGVGSAIEQLSSKFKK